MPPTVIGISGNSGSEHSESAKRAGMSYYLTKPVMRQDLEKVLSKCYMPGIQAKNTE